MKRASIRKASTFKLQGARKRFQAYLDAVEDCPVAKKFPKQLEVIRSSSQTVLDLCYSFRDDSPFIRALNYDNRFSGFHSTDNMMNYRDYLGQVKQAYLYGDFNEFNKTKHRLDEDEDMGKGWFKLTFDLNDFRLDEGSKLMLRVIDSSDKEFCFVPPSCRFISKGFGIYRRLNSKPQHVSKQKITHLLAYSIDLQALSLEECLKFIQTESDLLECYNTVILKNLFSNDHGFLHRFSLTPEQGDFLDQIVEKLSLLGVKVVLEWNFATCQLPQEANPLEKQYFIQSGIDYQFDLRKQSVLTYYLGNITQYFKYYGIGGIHFNKVHRISKEPNGILMIKMANILCQRINEYSITLASSKEFIVGLTEPIMQGGLGFGFTYNHHQSLSLSQQHGGIYEVVKQIHSSSNCLSLNFNEIQPREYIYLLFTFLISKKGVFTKGPIKDLKEELKKVLQLRRQEELFNQQCTMERLDEDCMVVCRGTKHIIFNFSEKQVQISMPHLQEQTLVFSQLQEKPEVRGDILRVKGHNCLLYQIQ